MQESEYTEIKSPEAAMPEINTQTGTLAKIQPAPQSQEQLLKYGEQVSSFLATLPDYLGSFFNTYKQPLITVGLIVTAIVTVKIVLAVLDALNDLPLVAPTFELIGIGYSVWFVYRYLLKASTREELANEVTILKTQVIGNQSLDV